MRVSLERTGGFSGTRVSATVDTESLSAEEAASLQQMVRSAGPFLTEPGETHSTGHPDQYSYRLTVTDGDRTRTVYIQEGDVSAELRPLLNWLIARARRRRPAPN